MTRGTRGESVFRIILPAAVQREAQEQPWDKYSGAGGCSVRPSVRAGTRPVANQRPVLLDGEPDDLEGDPTANGTVEGNVTVWSGSSVQKDARQSGQHISGDSRVIMGAVWLARSQRQTSYT